MKNSFHLLLDKQNNEQEKVMLELGTFLSFVFSIQHTL